MSDREDAIYIMIEQVDACSIIHYVQREGSEVVGFMQSGWSFEGTYQGAVFDHLGDLRKIDADCREEAIYQVRQFYPDHIVLTEEQAVTSKRDNIPPWVIANFQETEYLNAVDAENRAYDSSP